MATDVGFWARMRREQRHASRACRVRSIAVVVVLKIAQLRLQIRCTPEQHVVEKLATNRADQSLDKRMRQWNVRNRLDFLDLEHPEIGLPLVVPVQRITIRTQVFRKVAHPDRSLQHPAQRCTVNYAAMYAEPNNTTCKLVHRH